MSTRVLPAIVAAASLCCSSLPFRSGEAFEEGPRGPEVVHEGVVVLPSADEELDHGALLISDGKFEDAIKVYLKVYGDRATMSEDREEALLRLGYVYSNLLNPRRDNDKALFYLRKLLMEFPETKLRGEAEERIDLIREVHRPAPER